MFEHIVLLKFKPDVSTAKKKKPSCKFMTLRETFRVLQKLPLE